MPVTTIEGVVENGRIRLQDDVSLPENTKVYVIVPAAGAQVASPRLADSQQAKDFRKQVREVPPNA